MNAFDPAIPQLQRVLDPLAATDLLRDLCRTLTGHGSRVVGVELLKHKPGRRCALGYAIEGPHGKARLFAKVFAKDRGRAVFRTTRSLRKALARSDALGVPRPLAYFPTLRMLVTEFIEGSRLLSYDEHSAEAGARIADALRAVHALEPHGRRNWDSAQELDTALRWAAVLRTNRPDLASAVRLLEQRLEQDCSAAPRSVTGLVHRDIYPEQFIDADGRTVLLDWDDLRDGDGAVDVGNLLAHLELRAAQFPDSAERCSQARRSFLQRYLCGVNDLDSASLKPRIRLYEATSLLRLAGVYAARKRWVDVIPQPVIAACAAVLEQEVAS